MANIITYNQVVELLTDIARRHYQVNTFYLGRNWELENSDDILYPLFQVYPDFGRLPINAFNEYRNQFFMLIITKCNKFPIIISLFFFMESVK